MTTIIGIQHPAGATLGWDSLVGAEGPVFEDEAPKVFTNGGVVYGVAGPLTLANAIRHARMPDADSSNCRWDTDQWVENTLVPAIVNTLARRQVLKLEDGRPDLEGAILVVVRNRLYEIDFDTSVSRRKDGRHAIGSGAPYALGALAAGASILDALEIAASLDSGTGGSLHVVQTSQILDGTVEDAA